MIVEPNANACVLLTCYYDKTMWQKALDDKLTKAFRCKMASIKREETTHNTSFLFQSFFLSLQQR